MDWLAFNSRVLSRIESDNFEGYDPFDGLNSRLFSSSPFYRYRFARLVVLQLLKRSPVNLRGFLMVPKSRNPKGIALVILGSVYDHLRTGDDSHIARAVSLAHWLIDNSCDEEVWSGKCWGYNFDWQARAFFVAKGTPNIITTTYVAKALYTLGQYVGNDEFVEASVSASKFIEKNLLVNKKSGRYFAYIPGEDILVHNASLWGAACCGTTAALTGNQSLIGVVEDVVGTTLKAQRPDGSWLYGEAPFHQFIDGFHTGYNIEAIDEVNSVIPSEEFAVAVERGMRYYLDNFFTVDGVVKYYDKSEFPIDMHSVAQALLLLSRHWGDLISDRDRNLRIDKIMNWVSLNMCNPSGDAFYYQKNRYFVNKVRYFRWTQAWMYYAIARWQSYDS